MKIKKLFLLNLLLLCGFIIMSGCKSCKKESNKKEDPFLASFSNYLETRKNTDTSFIFKNPVKTLDFIFEVLSKNESPFIRGQVQKGLVFTNNKNLKEWMGVSNKCPMMGFLPPNIPGIQFELFYCSENPQRIIKDHKLKKVSEHLWKHEKELYFSYQNNIVLISTKIIDPLTFKELSTSKQKIPKDYLTDQEIFIFPRYSSKDKTEIESTLKIIAKTEAKNFKGKLIVDKIKNPQKVYDPNLANSWSYLSKHPMVKAFLLLPINFKNFGPNNPFMNPVKSQSQLQILTPLLQGFNDGLAISLIYPENTQVLSPVILVKLKKDLIKQKDLKTLLKVLGNIIQEKKLGNLQYYFIHADDGQNIFINHFQNIIGFSFTEMNVPNIQSLMEAIYKNRNKSSSQITLFNLNLEEKNLRQINPNKNPIISPSLLRQIKILKEFEVSINPKKPRIFLLNIAF